VIDHYLPNKAKTCYNTLFSLFRQLNTALVYLKESLHIWLPRELLLESTLSIILNSEKLGANLKLLKFVGYTKQVSSLLLQPNRPALQQILNCFHRASNQIIGDRIRSLYKSDSARTGANCSGKTIPPSFEGHVN
jgi:hypothetical protein